MTRLHKSLISLLFAAFLALPLLLGFPARGSAGPAAAPEVSAQGIALLDGATGQMVYGKNPHERFAMASLTKTMTAVVALEHGDIDRKVVVDVTWDEIPDSSIMGLSLMEELTIRDLLYGMMLPSGNDAARAIARAIAGDEYRFAQLMNEKARELGMTDTHYVNPHGMDAEEHYSSAYDQAKLGMYAMQNPLFRKIVSTTSITVRGIGVYPLRNINRVLLNYDGCDGIKTGYTDNARSAVIATAERDGRRVYVGVLRSWDYTSDAIAMMDYYFQNGLGEFPESASTPAPTAAASPTATPLHDCRGTVEDDRRPGINAPGSANEARQGGLGTGLDWQTT
ncbi:MAG: D-alanyl-D-alanine carboxypeptidase, partial [Dehalococcoidales bacterium]|nr:D-alanyl-D-alanine carboxypeptidase [Dehalococcoidales bacterium]